MGDPVERMVRFLRDQKQQAISRQARDLWGEKVPALLAFVQGVVRAFETGLAEPTPTARVSILVDPRHPSPLVVAFNPRRVSGANEAGASAHFRCEEGVVRGYRYPFHGVDRDVRPQLFVELGAPQAVQGADLGHAVAEFLEWASVGPGCGSRKMRFWAEGENLGNEGNPDLRIVAA
jgi:hypothetical protein